MIDAILKILGKSKTCWFTTAAVKNNPLLNGYSDKEVETAIKELAENNKIEIHKNYASCVTVIKIK